MHMRYYLQCVMGFLFSIMYAEGSFGKASKPTLTEKPLLPEPALAAMPVSVVNPELDPFKTFWVTIMKYGK